MSTRPEHGWSQRIARPLRGVVDAIFPQVCVACRRACGGDGGGLCRRCVGWLANVTRGEYCHRCARTIQPEARREKGCAYCEDEKAWNIAGIVRIGPYDEPLRQAVLALKYSGNRQSAQLLGRYLAERIQTADWLPQIDCLVPVPMHALRRFQRNSNHALLLAEQVGGWLKRPVVRAVSRVRYSPSQTEIREKAERFRNVDGCFGASRTFWRGSIAGKNVCIIDNLLNSGATLHEVAKTVRTCGAKSICAAIVARATPAGDPSLQQPLIVTVEE